MTTTTAPDVIEGIDMESVPVCESVYGCDRSAKFRVKPGCRCGAALGCQECTDKTVAMIADMLARRGPLRCTSCGTAALGPLLSDVLTVTPL